MIISVAMATYNGEKYIDQQLMSILKQTMAVDEVIICDDCSQDNTVAIIKNFISKYNLGSSWKVEVNERNLGYASNFIQAVSRTNGAYIFFCDQDDIWVLDRVERLTKVMAKNSNIKMLGSEFVPFASSKNAPSISMWEKRRFRRDESIEHLQFHPKNIFIGCQGCSMCIRRDFFLQIKPYWYEGWAHDEFVWKLALCLQGAYIYHGITIKRRLHATNITMHKMRGRKERIRFLEELAKSHEATLKFSNDNGRNIYQKNLLKRNIDATRLRIALLQKRNYWNAIILFLKYQDCYHSRRAIPVEFMMAFKGQNK